MKRLPLSAFPKRVQDQITAQLHATQKLPPVVEEGEKLIRQSSRQPNKWEAQVGDWLREVYGIDAVKYETVTLKLGNGSRYTPDFVVWCRDPYLYAYEVKGHKREAAIARLKIAASLFPWIRFRLVWFKRGEMQIQEVLP